ncbi:polyphosphate kinase 2 family protein [Nocardioides panacis]|uniref:Polyphosphate kinase 2 family protein n=1 Tax=Nocardioides panacis TaxID=2849501 RepID=A0A975T0U7_9ACTN|nr:PPK2 family polyphosphate kinase [Nocardioides panacis]QWZ09342.1 polyphosphate kinase 2 family protein [Nocardioides panacis]
MAKSRKKQPSTTEALTVPRGPVDLSTYDAHGKPGFDGSKKKGKAALYALGKELSDLQERLYAEGVSGGNRRVLVVLQGMDTSGKGGILRHAMALVDPQGLHIKAFKAPTPAELRHDFLWRVEREVPGPGMIGVFDRSHYEDVLIARVRKLVPRREISARYRQINAFEKRLADEGTVLVKLMLHISAEEQKQRLLARLDEPTKLWKFNPGDIDERQRWGSYQEAYEVALEKTNTEHAPWLVVPSDRKWYRDLAVANVLRETLAAMDPTWPGPDFDVAHERARLTGEVPSAHR